MKNKFLLVFFLFISIVTFSQEKISKKRNSLQTAGYVLKTSFNTIPSDFVHFGKEFSSNWERTGYYAAGIFGLILTDKITTKFWHNTVEPAIDYKLPNITVFGLESSKNPWVRGNSAYLTYPSIGLYLTSLVTNNEKGQFASINAFKAIAYSTLITQLTIKTIFGRNRPHRPLDASVIPEPWTNDNFDFFNKRKVYLYSSIEASSFPSLHTTAYFAIAKVFQMEYNNYWIPYGLMSIAWLADIKSHNHWFSDLVLGGILGTVIGRSIVKSSWKARGITTEKKKGITFNYTPSISSKFTGIRIVGTIN